VCKQERRKPLLFLCRAVGKNRNLPQLGEPFVGCNQSQLEHLGGSHQKTVCGVAVRKLQPGRFQGDFMSESNVVRHDPMRLAAKLIGLLERQGSSFGRSLDDPVYVPMSIYNQMYGSQRGSAVLARRGRAAVSPICMSFWRKP